MDQVNRILRLRAITISVFLTVLITLMLIVLNVSASMKPSQPPYQNQTYCQNVGDNNCDGMITRDETGWRCVPANGGPLTC